MDRQFRCHGDVDAPPTPSRKDRGYGKHSELGLEGPFDGSAVDNGIHNREALFASVNDIKLSRED